jgi:hypothetical protein
VRPVPVPIDCLDGFVEAFYARPEGFLDERVRRSQSGWAFVDRAVEERFVTRLDKTSGPERGTSATGRGARGRRSKGRYG